MTTPLNLGLPLAELTSREGPTDNSGRNLEQVAAEFESLMMAQMLKSFREAAQGGWLGESEDQASQTMMELAEQQFARTLAAQGGLGLRDLIVHGLTRPEPGENPDAGEFDSPAAAR